ncbi:MAG: hypothetical protein RLZZ540_2426 [Bacteroidota bacterium]|jgi:hypothetical protein
MSNISGTIWDLVEPRGNSNTGKLTDKIIGKSSHQKFGAVPSKRISKETPVNMDFRPNQVANNYMWSTLPGDTEYTKYAKAIWDVQDQRMYDQQRMANISESLSLTQKLNNIDFVQTGSNIPNLMEQGTQTAMGFEQGTQTSPLPDENENDVFYSPIDDNRSVASSSRGGYISDDSGYYTDATVRSRPELPYIPPPRRPAVQGGGWSESIMGTVPEDTALPDVVIPDLTTPVKGKGKEKAKDDIDEIIAKLPPPGEPSRFGPSPLRGPPKAETPWKPKKPVRSNSNKVDVTGSKKYNRGQGNR